MKRFILLQCLNLIYRSSVGGSPLHRGPSPLHRPGSPIRRSSPPIHGSGGSPMRRGVSPGHRSGSPMRRPSSPGRRSGSPLRRAVSPPHRRSGSPPHRHHPDSSLDSYYEYDRSPVDSPHRFMYDQRERSRGEPSPPAGPRSDISADSIERGYERSQARWLEELKAQGAKVVQVTYPRTANNDKELSVIRGEFLEILDDSRKWWKARNSRGQVAHVPHTIVTPYLNN